LLPSHLAPGVAHISAWLKSQRATPGMLQIAMPSPLIEIERLQKITGELALSIEAFQLNPGEIAAIVGPVGSGKTELLNLLTGQARPSSGVLRVCGLSPLSHHKQLTVKVGVLFSSNNLYERLSARQNLVFHCRMRGLPATRADEILAEVGLMDHHHIPAARLPASLARRLAFGRAILHHPTVLLLKDPFAGCEADSKALLVRLIRQRAANGAAVLILAQEGAGLANLCGAVYSLEGRRLAKVEMPSPDRETRSDLPFKVPARQEGQVVLVNPADILYASAEEDQTCLHTFQGDVPSHLTMEELEERLARNGFFRAHRSYLVNLQRVKAIIPYTRDSFTLILDDPSKTEIPLSKSAAKELRELLGY